MKRHEWLSLVRRTLPGDGVAFLVAYSLAEYADADLTDNRAFPSILRVSTECGLSEAGGRKAIRRLRDRGLLAVTYGPGAGNHYMFRGTPRPVQDPRPREDA